MKFKDTDANAIFNGIPFISIDKANKLIEAALVVKEKPNKRKKK